jgi:hypothetical protein
LIRIKPDAGGHIFPQLGLVVILARPFRQFGGDQSGREDETGHADNEASVREPTIMPISSAMSAWREAVTAA